MVEKKDLSAEAYNVCWNKGTEAPFSGKYYMHKEAGIYTCVSCDGGLFSSDAKYDSGSGWPAFFDVLSKANVACKKDHSHGMVRTEVLCGNCGAHLGHVFDDGPQPTGKRYCINSVAMCFKPSS